MCNDSYLNTNILIKKLVIQVMQILVRCFAVNYRSITLNYVLIISENLKLSILEYNAILDDIVYITKKKNSAKIHSAFINRTEQSLFRTCTKYIISNLMTYTKYI